MNTNASRFSHVVSLDFDQAGQVASASIQVDISSSLNINQTTFLLITLQNQRRGCKCVCVRQSPTHFVSLCSDNAAGETEGEQTP